MIYTKEVNRIERAIEKLLRKTSALSPDDRMELKLLKLSLEYYIQEQLRETATKNKDY